MIGSHRLHPSPAAGFSAVAILHGHHRARRGRHLGKTGADAVAVVGVDVLKRVNASELFWRIATDPLRGCRVVDQPALGVDQRGDVGSVLCEGPHHLFSPDRDGGLRRCRHHTLLRTTNAQRSAVNSAPAQRPAQADADSADTQLLDQCGPATPPPERINTIAAKTPEMAGKDLEKSRRSARCRGRCRGPAGFLTFLLAANPAWPGSGPSGGGRCASWLM